MSNTPEHKTHIVVGHEDREASPKLIVETLVGLTISVILVCVIVWGIFVLLQKTSPQPVPSPVALAPQMPPGPHVEEHPAEELKTLHAREDELLYDYGWVDQKAGLVHIPIDKAMDAVVSKLPVRPQQQAPARPPRLQQVSAPQGGANATPR